VCLAPGHCFGGSIHFDILNSGLKKSTSTVSSLFFIIMDTSEDKLLCMNNLCTEKGLKQCTRCKFACYCSKECQKDHWRRHKQCCKMITAGPEMSLRFFKAVNDCQIASNQRDSGDFDQALLSYQESLEIFKEFENDLFISKCYYDNRSVLSSKKQYEEALVNFRKALKICREIHGENNVETCGCYEAIGNVLGEQGRNNDALIGYGKALAIRVNLFGEHHLETANSYYYLGITQLRKGDFHGALISLEKAEEICSRELGSEHTKTLQTNVWIDF